MRLRRQQQRFNMATEVKCKTHSICHPSQAWLQFLMEFNRPSSSSSSFTCFWLNSIDQSFSISVSVIHLIRPNKFLHLPSSEYIYISLSTRFPLIRSSITLTRTHKSLTIAIESIFFCGFSASFVRNNIEWVADCEAMEVMKITRSTTRYAYLWLQWNNYEWMDACVRHTQPNTPKKKKKIAKYCT